MATKLEVAGLFQRLQEALGGRLSAEPAPADDEAYTAAEDEIRGLTHPADISVEDEPARPLDALRVQRR
ncbi:MAG TPA: hypothetical protein VEO00_00160 [Actinomycetota bacterium]|nr:hypothetical protein [Candidatus Acidoferrum sp.]HYU56447.1 hypothetical protein [Actinomycetota bacterium]